MKKDFAIKLLISVGLCLLVGYISGVTTSSAIETWYPSLNKPAFNPPDWVFAPVWTILFIMMGIAAARVWHRGWERKAVKVSLSLFAFQLLLNGLWSQFFFGMKDPFLAFVDILLLILSIALCIYYFARLDKPSAWLMVPYLGWVSFATVLNFAILQLNPEYLSF